MRETLLKLIELCEKYPRLSIEIGNPFKEIWLESYDVETNTRCRRIITRDMIEGVGDCELYLQTAIDDLMEHHADYIEANCRKE